MKEETNETMMLNNNAGNQPFTLKPGTISDAHLMIRILITSRNKPNVKMVIGIVSTMSIGFTKLLSKPKTTATRIAVVVSFTLTPFKINDASSMATDVMSVLERNLIIEKN